MAEGTNSKSWQKFMKELESEGVDFASIQHADEDTRVQLLASMSSLTPLDRAAVTTTWKRLASAPQDKSTTDSSTPSRDTPAVPAKEKGASAARGSPLYDQQQNLINPLPFGQPQVSINFNQNDSLYIPPQLPRAEAMTTSPMMRQPSSAAQANVPVMSVGVNGDDLPNLLRAALDRGDCGTALPLASEMLQSDPIELVHLLHEYLPQLSVDQLKTILGVGMTFPEPAGSPVSPPRGGTASPKTSGVYSPTEEIEMNSMATLNGQAVFPGQFITQQQMQAQFGARFTALCNGAPIRFPYTVQRGDKIVVRSASERLM